MARAAKKETPLTTEEKLAKALVPEEERPYPVPENWCWIYLKSISIIKTGKKDANYGVVNGQYYFFTCAAEPIRCNGYSFEGKYILLAGNGDIGNISLYDGKFEAYQRTYVLSIHPHYNTEYIYYNLLFRWVDYNANKMFGSAIPYVRLGNLQKFPIPLPPFPEQHRIVTLIESLFADLDAAKEKLQAVLDGFAERRAALLHQAFTGELTREWREENGINDSWNTVRFDEVARVKSNLVDPAEYQNFPHIAPDNVEKKTGKLLDFHTVAEDKVTSGKHRFYDGQILYSKIRPYLSKVVLVDFDGLCSADMYPIESKEQVDIKYLWYYMLSDDFLTQASTAGSRTVLPKINQKELSALSIRITTHPEQKEIVRVLDDVFAKESQSKAAVESALAEIETMKKAILATAFRGGFGTGDENDESAVQLLRDTLESH